ncbi:MAG: hypothetical protein QM778_20895 [Myxococcales bacterium]
MNPTQTRAILLALGLSAVGTAYAAAANDTTIAGWTPLVTMWGAGDTGVAVKSLDRLTRAFETFLHKTEVDKPTQKFIDKAWKEFEDFDLKGFQALLPDERAGRRELTVKGELSGDKYMVIKTDGDPKYNVGLDTGRNGLADMSLLLHGKQRETKDNSSLLFGIRWGLGVGQLSYSSLIESGHDLARLATDGDPRGASATDKPAPSAATISKIKSVNPGLGAEDINVLAVLYEAFPALGEELVSNIGRAEDIQDAQNEGNYHHIKMRIRAEPDRLKNKYPNFAKHVKKLKDVLTTTLRVLDDQGRDLVRLHIDSEKLLFGCELYIRDGQVLPFDDNQVYESEPLDPLAANLKHPQVMINARLNMLGIIVNVKGLRVESNYDVHGTYVSNDGWVRQMPKVKVEGRALGLFSPGFLDVFISSNIQQITEDFFRMAVKGNDGKGVTWHAELGSRSEGQPGVFSVVASAEALESWIIKFGGSVAVDRLLMNEKAEQEAKQLAADLHDAFVRDFKRFQTKAGGAG